LVCCIAEVAGPSGYWVEKGAMFALGNPPDRWLEMAAALERAFTIGEAMLTGGTRASEIAAVVSRIASEAGYRVGISSGHGAGMDSDLPALTGDDDRPLEPGMVICLHPHLCDERYGAFAIDQYTITEGPPQRHSRFARCLYHR
jgi:Xaa-Pro aminopeptidase